MQIPSLITRGLAPLRDRERAVSFGAFLWQRFLDDRLFQAAGSLAYTTVFAIVPLAVVVFGVLSAFPVFNTWSDQLSHYIFTNFVPSAARAAEGYLHQFSASAGQLTAAGFIALVVSLLITLNSVEATFNQIWRVSSARPKLTRFLVYWTVLTLGAMLAAALLAMSSRVFALPLFGTSEGQWLATLLLDWTPVLVELVCVMGVYRVVPHLTVHWRHAFAGALLATLILEAVKWGMGMYLSSFQSYQKLYGTVAFVPILLLWIYLCWVSVLLGASLASSLAAFRYQPQAMRLPAGQELYALLRVLGRFGQARIHGQGLSEEALLVHEPMLTDSQLQQFLLGLESLGIVRDDGRGEWLLARDLDRVLLGELYEQLQLRIPAGTVTLPLREDVLGQQVCATLDDLRQPLAATLQLSVARILSPVGETN